ncbi:MAG: alpha/beta hydrolase [Candidatus Doudnabacteria bacterium]|nr:alpha/beta hydrolase [Candidatus Doudnabacteria bacterium]
MEKIFIKNRNGQKIAVVIEQPEGKARGLAFVMDGLSGIKESLHVRAMAESFLANMFIVVTFDFRNTYGESEGKYENANVTNYYEDLEDVVNWSSKQNWYQEPFWLAGHSLGGMCAGLFAEKYPEKIFALAPIAAAVVGKLIIKKYQTSRLEQYKIWEKTGIREETSSTRPDLIKRLNWHQFKQDLLKYSLLDKVSKLTMPTLLVVGDKDELFEQQKILFEKLPGKKELHIVKKAPHTFIEANHLTELKQIFDKWIKSLN